MIREQKDLFFVIHQGVDLLIVIVGFFLACLTKVQLQNGHLNGQPDSYYVLLFISLISYHFSLRFLGCYGPYRKLSQRHLVSRVLKATFAGTLGITFLVYMVHLQSISRLLTVFFTFYVFVGLVLFRMALYRFLKGIRLSDYNTRSMLIIGSQHRTLDFIRAVKRERATGYRIYGCLETNDRSERVGEKLFGSVKIIGTMDNFKELLKNQAIDEVVFGIPLKMIENVDEYIYYAEEMGKTIRVLPDFQINTIKYYPQTAKVDIDSFFGAITLVLSSVPKNPNELMIKFIIDYAVAAAGLILLSPLFILLGTLIKLTSKGPVIFSQERSGLNGRRFKLHKFRTMVVNAEELREHLATENEMDGPVFKIKKDPRITWIGAILRKTSLDELPQLFNVLKGEMSLVGPRPPIPAEVEQYKLWQRRRLSMKPGLTCIWQVSGRNNISFEKWMNMDLEYIDNWSIGLDIKLLLLTFKEVAFGGGH